MVAAAARTDPPGVKPEPAAPPPGPTPDAPTPRAGLGRLASYRLFWGLAAAILVLDQATKAWVAARIPFNPLHAHGGNFDHEVIGGFLYLIHVGNTGAAWSMFSGQSVLLALLAAATLIGIFLWRHSLGLREPLGQICFGLLCGGVVGNLVDRLIHGHVIDFVDLHFGSYIYPTFNVADSGICVGVLLYLGQSLREPH